MTWEETTAYCENLTEGGYSDWHLPTISELRTLIRNCPWTMTGGSCGVTDSCLSYDCWNEHDCEACDDDAHRSYSVFGDTKTLWSSSDLNATNFAWHVDFEDGSVEESRKTDRKRVRCVR